MITPGRARYTSVNDAWDSVTVPTITRAEAERASRALYHRFGRKTAEHNLQLRSAKPEPVRRCWIALGERRGLDKGWPRLVHDVSHRIFRYRYPGWRPHHPTHAALELEITNYVITQTEWLSGGLQPKAKAKPSPDDTRTLKLSRTVAALSRWDAKLRRAQNAIAKLKRRRYALVALSLNNQKGRAR